MAYLIDTNVLLRRARPSDPHFSAARTAIEVLVRSGESIYISSQNVVEFWNVLTRPAGTNGFGMSPPEADHQLVNSNIFSPSCTTRQTFIITGGSWLFPLECPECR